MLCIFCLKDGDSSDEHIFPLGIGGMLKIDRVCRVCNSKLGIYADAPLTEHLVIKLIRSELSLAGNSGNIPDGIKELLGEGVLAYDNTQKFKLINNPSTGKLEPRLIYKTKSIISSDGTEVEQISIDATDGEVQLKNILTKKAKRAGKILSNSEIERLSQELVKNNTNTVDRPEVLVRPSIDLVAYRKGIIKIIYELAFLWLGESYLYDPISEKLRAISMGQLDFDQSKLNGSIILGELEPLRYWNGDENSHIAYSCVHGNNVAICIKIFNIFSACVVVTESAEKYSNCLYDPNFLRFISIDPVNKVMHQSAFIDEIKRMAKAMVI